STSKTPSYTKSVSWQHHHPVFTEDAINKRKHERELLNKICILSMLARLRPIQKGCAQ
ncbi:hypothetical protein FSF51_026105, partial [Escherichia coli]|nr:hypothetical protein [Escherichia coli]